MSPPNVSIIIPCYNAQAWVGDAIESALTQTYSDKEVIVIDDGSTDGSLDVIRSFDKKIRWTTGARRGACAARNAGVSMSSSDWIQFLDADDCLHVTKLERQIPTALRHLRMLSCSDWDVTSTDGGGSRTCSAACDNGDTFKFVLQNQLQTSSPLHRKAELLRIAGWDENLPCCQEFDLHLRLACNGIGFVRVPEVLFTVRRRSGSLSDDTSRVLAQYGAILSRARDMLEAHGNLSDERAVLLATALARAGRHYIQRGKNDEGISYLQAAKRMHPRGVHNAYRWPVRLLCQALGPVLAERMVMNKRRLAGNGGIP